MQYTCSIHSAQPSIISRLPTASVHRHRLLPQAAHNAQLRTNKTAPIGTISTNSATLKINTTTSKNTRKSVVLNASSSDNNNSSSTGLVGEDAAVFNIEDQKVDSWVKFFAILATVTAVLYGVWIAPGIGLGEDFVASIESLASNNSEVAITLILAVFALVHSGLAYLRPYGEDLIGARAYRVLFASISLPLAVAAVVFFINHRYDGTALWNIRGVPGVHEAVWISSFLSFYLLYPSTFNILEVAAVDEPKQHLWETGVIRITRHPQMWGQLLWCIAHTAWIGSSFMVVTSLGLMAHHLFGCWHGDYRLKRKYGEAFEEVKARTSFFPFAAILDGRQKLPDDYWKEWVRGPYLFLIPFCVGAYLCHPLMQQGSYWLGW